MKNILQALNERPIAYYPAYRKITGSTTAAIYLSQVMYWFSKKDKFFKTDAEIMEETLLTRKEIENAKKLIKKLDFITITREGIPAKTYYEIDWNKFAECLNNLEKECENDGETSNHEKCSTVSPKGGNCTPQKDETIIVKSLTKTTTEITTETSIKNTQKGYEDFIKLLKSQAPIKSKVTKTRDGYNFFKQIADKEKLLHDYIEHQHDKKEFAKRITPFMEDYNTMPTQTSTTSGTMQAAGQWAMNKLNGPHTQQGGAIC